jgi:periplasmic protein TonB
MESNKILSADILDIIFEGKNKEYGAYDLRKTYNKRLTMALIITGSIFLLFFLGSLLANVLHSNSNQDFDVKDLTLTEVKKPEKPLPPPPPPPKLPPPPKIETIKFTPPKIVKDEEVKPEEKPPENKDLDKAVVSTETQKGAEDPGVTAPPVQEASQAVAAPPDDNEIFTKVEKEAGFPGGAEAWKRYLERNLNSSAPVENGAPEGTYTVIVKFIVSKDGSISDVQAETNFGYGMEDEAMKQIKKSPKWTPGLQNGRNVNSYCRQPITFVVQSQ